MTQTYPGADTRSQWYADNYPGDSMNTNCGVLHTTETSGWPGYGGGATAPNATGLPNMATKRIDWREHYPTDMSSRALRNLPGGVETNTLNAVQLELVGTCDPKYRVSRPGWGKAGVDYIFWPEAPDWALASLGKRLAWYAREHGVPLTTPRPGRWAAYPGSYGFGAHQRLSAAEWRALKGWVGHQHVPENDHGDPGALDIDRVLSFARQALTPPQPVKPAKPKPLPTLVRGFIAVRGQKDLLKAVQAVVGVKPDGYWGPKTATAIRLWKVRVGLRTPKTVKWADGNLFGAKAWAKVPDNRRPKA